MQIAHRPTSSLSVLVAVIVATTLGGTQLQARTWYVTADSTGDAPFINAAMDSSSAGDTVLVAAGLYEVLQISMANGVVLISESGPEVTRFTLSPGSFSPSGIACTGLQGPTEIIGFWFDGFNDQGTSSGAISVFTCVGVLIAGNVFTNNVGGGVFVYLSYVAFRHNTFVGNELAIVNDGACGVLIENILWDPTDDMSSFIVACNDFLDEADIPDLVKIANFSQDPLFCGPDDFRISSNSPCMPGNAPVVSPSSCALIGALPSGCDTTPVKARSWGRLKAEYIDR